MSKPKREDYDEQDIRSMGPDSALNRICAEWEDAQVKRHPPRYAQDWRHAGRLLEAMPEIIDGWRVSQTLQRPHDKSGLWIAGVFDDGNIWSNEGFYASAETPELAISRYAALLWLRGVEPQ